MLKFIRRTNWQIKKRFSFLHERNGNLFNLAIKTLQNAKFDLSKILLERRYYWKKKSHCNFIGEKIKRKKESLIINLLT